VTSPPFKPANGLPGAAKSGNGRGCGHRRGVFLLAGTVSLVALVALLAGCSQPKPAGVVVTPAGGSRVGAGPVPIVRVQVEDSGAVTGRPSFVFTIQRTGDTGRPLTVHYRVGGSAANGADYVRLPGVVVIAAGQSSARIEVKPRRGRLQTASKEVALTLVSPSEPFTLVALPDTQFYTDESSGGTRDIFTSQTRWIVEQRDKLNIVFVLHEGDVTDKNTMKEWVNARSSMGLLDGVVPYAVAVGNHDGVGHTTLFNQFFPLCQFQNYPTWGGAFDSGLSDNCYQYFTAGGVDWLVLSLEFGPRNRVLAWANRVAASHPDRRVIVLTHTHVYFDNTLHGSSVAHMWKATSYGRENNGTDVWEKFLRHHANVSFVFNGHVCGKGVGRLVGLGDAGNPVFQMLANYQMLPRGGSGFLRIMQFFPQQDRLSVKTYSPFVNQWITDPDNQFEYDHLGIFGRTAPDYAVEADHANARLTVTGAP
jgi:Calcineurin-like phosphoesterase